jgi:hypothetical protein
MAVEKVEDRTLLLADFGITATVTPSGGSASDITVIFDNEYIDVDIGEAGVQSTQPKFICKTTDVSSLTEGDTAVINSITYYIQIIQQDGTGFSEVFLRVAS